MRKRRIRIRTIRRKLARGGKARQALRFKVVGSRPLPECKTCDGDSLRTVAQK